jgi:hypothetical protein
MSTGDRFRDGDFLSPLAKRVLHVCCLIEGFSYRGNRRLVALYVIPAHAAFTVATFTDVSQLDFSGNFAYAGSVGVDLGNLPVTIGDATFTDQDALWTGSASNGYTTFGPGLDNASLNTVLYGIRYVGYAGDYNGPEGALPVVVGNTYKLQLLMAYYDRARSNQIEIEGVNQTPTFDTVPNDYNQGTVSTFTYTATDDTLNIHIKGFAGSGAFGQPILNAFTLEDITVPEPASATLVLLSAVGMLMTRRGR